MAPATPAQNQANITPSRDEHDAVTRFVFKEAALADQGDYDGWLALWANENIQYWVPCNSDNADPAESLAIILDDRAHLEERLSRMKHRRAHTFSLSFRTQRVIGNVCVSSDDNELVATSSFVLGSISRGTQSVWFGQSEHKLTTTNGTLRIRQKTVNLLNNDEALTSLLFLP